VKIAVLLAMMVLMALALSACGWFGHKDEAAAAPAGDQLPSNAILKKDCTDPQWKQQNLGLWYSVCRQPMRW